MKNLILVITFLCVIDISFGQVQIRVKTTGAKLTESGGWTSKFLKTLEKGDSLTFLEFVYYQKEIIYKVEYQGIVGYISPYFINKDPLDDKAFIELENIEQRRIDSLEVVRNKEEIERRKEEIEKMPKYSKIDEEEEIRKNDSIADVMLKMAKTQNQITYQNNLASRREKFISKYGASNGERIATRKIWIGMTEEMLLDSWGKPEDINSTVTRYSISKQYVYGNGQYVYVVDGIVDAWQN